MLSFVTILRNKWNLICLKGEMKVLFHVFEHSLSSTSSSLMQKTQRATKQKRTISTSDSAWINKLISHSLFVVENKKARCKSITCAKWYVLEISNILFLYPYIYSNWKFGFVGFQLIVFFNTCIIHLRIVW